jgi:hypothetical protein
MITRSVVAGLVAALLLATPAVAAEAPRGRGPNAQARMDAVTAESGSGRVQILNETCRTPSRLRGCTPMSPALQRALDAAIDRRITWVTSRDVDGPEFWVFAPIEFEAGTATSEYAWWESGATAGSGCRGGITYDWSRRAGAWVTTSGIGWAACSAQA